MSSFALGIGCMSLRFINGVFPVDFSPVGVSCLFLVIFSSSDEMSSGGRYGGIGVLLCGVSSYFTGRLQKRVGITIYSFFSFMSHMSPMDRFSISCVGIAIFIIPWLLSSSFSIPSIFPFIKSGFSIFFPHFLIWFFYKSYGGAYHVYLFLCFSPIFFPCLMGNLDFHMEIQILLVYCFFFHK